MQIWFNRFPRWQLLMIVKMRIILDSLPVTPVIYVINSKMFYCSDVTHKNFNLRNFLFVVYKQLKYCIGTFNKNWPYTAFLHKNAPFQQRLCGTLVPNPCHYNTILHFKRKALFLIFYILFIYTPSQSKCGIKLSSATSSSWIKPFSTPSSIA